MPPERERPRPALEVRSRAPSVGWVDLKKPILSDLIVPDFASVAKKVIQKLATTFDELRGTNLLRLTEVLTDPTRTALDRAVSETFRVTADMTILRTLLASDPLFAASRPG